jgi:hypothetical protein
MTLRLHSGVVSRPHRGTRRVYQETALQDQRAAVVRRRERDRERERGVGISWPQTSPDPLAARKDD